MTVPTVDTHVHLATDDVATYPKADAPPFTTHAYVNRVEDFLPLMDGAGVQLATVVQPFALYGSDNRYHADAAAEHPDRLRSVCGLSPSGGSADALRRWVTDRRMAGVRVNTRGERKDLDDPAILALVDVAAELELPVTLLISQRHLDAARALAGRYPSATFLLDHLGGAALAVDGSCDRLARVAEAPNTYVKLTTEQLAPDGVEELLDVLLASFGPNRILWGSNFPVSDRGGYAATVDSTRDRLRFLAADVLARVMGGNALDIWKGWWQP